MAITLTLTADSAGETTSTTSSTSRSSTKALKTSTISGSSHRYTSTQSRSRSTISTSSSTFTTNTDSITLATSTSIASPSSSSSTPTPTISPNASNFGPVSQVNVGAIVGGVVAVVIVVAALVTVYCWWHARQSRQERQTDFARTSILRNSNSLDHDTESVRPSSTPKTLMQKQTPQHTRFSYTPISHETSFAYSYYAPTASPTPSARRPAIPPPLPAAAHPPPAPTSQSSVALPLSAYQPFPHLTTSHTRDSIPDFNSTLYTHDKDELDTNIIPRIHPAFRPHSYSLSAIASHNSEASKPRIASHSGHMYAPLSQEETPRIYGMPIPEIEIMDADFNTDRKEP